MTNNNSRSASAKGYGETSPKLEGEIAASEGGSSVVSHQPESADGPENVLIVPPVDESDITSHPASARGSGETSPKLEAEITASEGGPGSPKLETETAASAGGPESGWGEHAPAPAMEEVRAAIEAILYAAGEPVTIRELKKVFSDTDTENIKKGLAELIEIYSTEGRGLQIIEVAGGYQITTRPEYHDRVVSIFKYKPPSRLTIQSLETLATIAYRQPITVPEIMELRGVRSAGVVRTLLEKKLIRILGRKKVVGRPLLYGTTKEFLTRFGLKDMSELPRLEDMAEVFGDDIALQLEETLGEKDASAVAAAGSSDGSPEGGAASDRGAPGANPEDAAESDASERDGGEKEEGEK
jgi:segregation and condensation protein B